MALPNSQITNQGMNLICNELKTKKVPCSLTALNLSSCSLKARDVLLLAESLRHNKSLIKLDLSANGLDSKCGGYIANVLSVNFSLGVLSLADNELLDEFIDTLVASLKKNVTLFECDLTGNPFTTTGANTLFNAVRTN